MEFIVRTLGNAAGLWLATRLMSGLTVPGDQSTAHTLVNLLVVGLILALVNSVVKPVARFVTFPFYVITFGIFALVVNGLMLVLTSWLTDKVAFLGEGSGVALGLHVSSFGTAVVGALIVAVVSAVVVAVFGPCEN